MRAARTTGADDRHGHAAGLALQEMAWEPAATTDEGGHAMGYTDSSPVERFLWTDLVNGIR